MQHFPRDFDDFECYLETIFRLDIVSSIVQHKSPTCPLSVSFSASGSCIQKVVAAHIRITWSVPHKKHASAPATLSDYTCRATQCHADDSARLAATPATHTVYTYGKAVLELFQSNSVSLKTTTTKADHMYLFDVWLRVWEVASIRTVAVIAHNQLMVAVQPCSIVCWRLARSKKLAPRTTPNGQICRSQRSWWYARLSRLASAHIWKTKGPFVKGFLGGLHQGLLPLWWLGPCQYFLKLCFRERSRQRSSERWNVARIDTRISPVVVK